MHATQCNYEVSSPWSFKTHHGCACTITSLIELKEEATGLYGTSIFRSIVIFLCKNVFQKYKSQLLQ